MTPERLSALACRAYRDLGYGVVTFNDGSKGVLRCPTKTINLMNRFQELVLDALEAEQKAREATPQAGVTDEKSLAPEVKR